MDNLKFTEFNWNGINLQRILAKYFHAKLIFNISKDWIRNEHEKNYVAVLWMNTCCTSNKTIYLYLTEKFKLQDDTVKASVRNTFLAVTSLKKFTEHNRLFS